MNLNVLDITKVLIITYLINCSLEFNSKGGQIHFTHENRWAWIIL